MKIQKILIALCALLALNITACGEKKEEVQEGANKVAILQLVENTAFEDMRIGFIDHMTEAGYIEGSDISYHLKNAQGDSTNLNTICQELAGSNYDLILSIATPPTQAMVNMESEIPVFFAALDDPIGARVITDMNKPDKNATGTASAIPVNDIFELSNALSPNVKTFGLLYSTSEVNSITTIGYAKEYLEERNIPYVEAVAANSAEAQQTAQSLVGRVDALFVPADSVIQAAMGVVSEVAREAGIPIYACSAATVASGALATLAITDKDLGAATAALALEYLNGKSIANIPTVLVPAKDLVINKNTAEILGITVPELDGLILLEDNK